MITAIRGSQTMLARQMKEQHTRRMLHEVPVTDVMFRYCRVRMCFMRPALRLLSGLRQKMTKSTGDWAHRCSHALCAVQAITGGGLTAYAAYLKCQRQRWKENDDLVLPGFFTTFSPPALIKRYQFSCHDI